MLPATDTLYFYFLNIEAGTFPFRTRDVYVNSESGVYEFRRRFSNVVTISFSPENVSFRLDGHLS